MSVAMSSIPRFTRLHHSTIAMKPMHQRFVASVAKSISKHHQHHPHQHRFYHNLTPQSSFITSSQHTRMFNLHVLHAKPSHRTLFIQTQNTPNPNALKFLPGRSVLPADSQQTAMDFPSVKAAQNSPLASVLFQIDGVQGVLLGTDFVAVNVDDGVEWAVVKPHVFATISDFFASGKPVVQDVPVFSDTAILDSDDEVVSLIKELIETRIRPAVQEDGGDIVYKGMDRDQGVVRVQMVGSCKGCSSSSVTLKSGIENMLMHYVPEVTAVEEWIDPETEAMNQVSAEQLRKLEEGLAKVQGKTPPAAAPPTVEQQRATPA